MNTFLKTTFLTILFYRAVTFIIIYFWGSSIWWQSVTTDSGNHYQIGIVLILYSFIFLSKQTHLKFRNIIVAVGAGMIIDEISEVLKLLHLYTYPPDFRDSLSDLILIIISYLIFSVSFLSIYLALKRRLGK